MSMYESLTVSYTFLPVFFYIINYIIIIIILGHPTFKFVTGINKAFVYLFVFSIIAINLNCFHSSLANQHNYEN